MNNKKVVFIYPNFYRSVKYKIEGNVRATPLPPLGPLALASYIEKKGYEPKIIDMRLDCNDINLVLEETRDSILVCISAMTLQIKDALKICEAIKSENKVPIVFGDSHATLFAEQTCSDPLVDFVIVREGEEALLELLGALQGKTDFEHIGNLVYKKNSKVIINRLREYMDIENLPPYNYDLLQLDYYIQSQTQYEFRQVRKLAIETSRGCPHRCAFCINALVGRKWRAKSAEKVIGEIKHLVEKYKVEHITFIDPNCFVNAKRIREIAHGIINNRLNITWDGDCRVDYFTKGILDDETVALVKKSGCHRLIFGVESGSSITLELIKKDITINDVLECARICNNHNIIPLFSFMIGIPGEQREEIINTVKLMKQLRKICPKMESGMAVFMPYPGGELYSRITQERNFIEPKSLREWCKEDYLKSMDSENVSVSWNKNDEKYILDIHYYANLAYIMTKNQYKEMAKKNFIIASGLLFFVMLARMRWNMNFFSLAFDRRIYLFTKRVLNIL